MGYYKNEAVKRNDARRHANPIDYAGAWHQKMIEIWGDRLRLLQIGNTGALRQSVRSRSLNLSEDNIRMSFEFLQYGIYVDAGVGNGYTHGNQGNLDILNPIYREEHGLNRPRRRGRKADGKMTSGKPRKKRPWFSRSWYISVEVFKEALADMYGQEYVGLFDNI